MSGETVTCVDCGNPFELSYGEQRYFREHHLELPKRCGACRSRRRTEREAGMRGFSGPTVFPVSRLTTRLGPVGRVPVTSQRLTLWRNLRNADHYRYVERFSHLQVPELIALPIAEAGLLMQWMFEQHGLETQSVVAESRRVDLTLTNRESGWREFARVYLDGTAIPVNAMLTLLEDLKGTDFKRVHFYTTGMFSPAQKRLRYEFPLALEILEGSSFEQYLLEAQHQVRVQLDRRSRVHASANRPTAGWWASFKQMIRKWLGLGN